jgi:DNA-binding PadR family transcriptional regulator
MRLLLLRTEAIGVDKIAADRFHAECEKIDPPTRAYNILLMKEDGLVEALISNDEMGRPTKAVIQRMTTKGHEYLDKVRHTAPNNSGQRSTLT